MIPGTVFPKNWYLLQRTCLYSWALPFPSSHVTFCSSVNYLSIHSTKCLRTRLSHTQIPTRTYRPVTAKSRCSLAFHQLQWIQICAIPVTAEHTPGNTHAMVLWALSQHTLWCFFFYGSAQQCLHLFQSPDLPLGQESPVLQWTAWYRQTPSNSELLSLPSSHKAPSDCVVCTGWSIFKLNRQKTWKEERKEVLWGSRSCWSHQQIFSTQQAASIKSLKVKLKLSYSDSWVLLPILYLCPWATMDQVPFYWILC